MPIHTATISGLSAPVTGGHYASMEVPRLAAGTRAFYGARRSA